MLVRVTYGGSPGRLGVRLPVPVDSVDGVVMWTILTSLEMNQDTCSYRKSNGEMCKRKVSSGEPRRWQHASGLRNRWKSLTGNQSLAFFLVVAALILALIELYPIIFPPHPERPWVKTTLGLTRPLVIDADGLAIHTYTLYQNTGGSPAVDAVSDSRLYLITRPRPQAEESQIQKSFCNELESKVKTDKLLTRTISGFDNSPVFTRLNIGKAELEEAVRKYNGWILPVILSCVVYRSTFDRSTFHTTSESSIILTVDPSKPNSAALSIQYHPSLVIPLDRLGITTDISLPTRMD